MKIEKFLKKIFMHRVVKRSDGELYLTRYYVIRKPAWWLPSIYIHCFHSSDYDQELHNHGWSRSFSFILKGSYIEEIREKDNSVSTRILKPGNFNYITKQKFHRVDLLSDKVWTIFFSGTKKDPSWGFWNRNTNEYLDWQEHEKNKALKAASKKATSKLVYSYKIEKKLDEVLASDIPRGLTADDVASDV